MLLYPSSQRKTGKGDSSLTLAGSETEGKVEDQAELQTRYYMSLEVKKFTRRQLTHSGGGVEMSDSSLLLGSQPWRWGTLPRLVHEPPNNPVVIRTKGWAKWEHHNCPNTNP